MPGDPLPALLTLVGFARDFHRERAITRVAEEHFERPADYEFIAIPARDLTRYLGDGRKVAEVAGYEIAP